MSPATPRSIRAPRCAGPTTSSSAASARWKRWPRPRARRCRRFRWSSRKRCGSRPSRPNARARGRRDHLRAVRGHRHRRDPWLLLPAALSLAVFAWLLTLHPTATGRVYAAYGGVYIGTALAWLWAVDGVRPTRWDLLGVGLCLAGMAVIMLAPRQA